MAERLRALLIAPPGAGKGTQADRICDHFGVAHVSTGERFRSEIAAGTALGRLVKRDLDRGDLVPDEIVEQVARDLVEQAMRTHGGFLLDGFPRTVAQAEAARAIAEERGWTAHAVLTFDVPRDVLVERLLGRAKAEGRTDDDEATILHRLDVYETETAPLLDFYAGRGLLVRIDANQPIEDVTLASIEALQQALTGWVGGATLS